MRSFKEKVVYQIYPKSFNDSNGDGIGDLQGIIAKLPHFVELGVEILWLSPIFPSPHHDNGYDVSDYYGIDPMFGTMEDFQQLVLEAKKINIEIMLDMVLNHTSIQHEWFQKALQGDKTYQDYYILRPAQIGGALPTNWDSKFGGPVWEKFGESQNYYLHLFDKTQADLNWRNPAVRKEMQKIVNFWIDQGVRGFRFDVINLIGKDAELLDDPTGDGKPLYTDKPIVHEYLQELQQATYGRDVEIVTVGEMSATSIENCLLYTEPKRKELNMTFNFHHLKVDYKSGEKWSLGDYDFKLLRNLFHDWGERMSEGEGWNALFWNNHDQPRALGRFVDEKKYYVAGAKMLAAAIHLSRGTPYIYQGEEIGMTNPYFKKITDYQDIESKNAFYDLLEKGFSQEQSLKIIQKKSRDNSRTPIPWSSDIHGSFSEGEPWIKLNEDYTFVNVENEKKQGSIFSFYQKLIELRKMKPVISKGSYHQYLTEYDGIYGYIRKWRKERLIVVNNFFAEDCEINLTEEIVQGEILVTNYHRLHLEQKLKLRPYETLAIFVK